MRTGFRNIITFVFAFQSCLVYSQKDCTVPVSPVLNLLSVQLETGFVELSWSLSPSTDIAAYIVYNHNSGYWITIDTIWDPAATSYLYKSNGTKYFSESYVVAAFRKPVCTSPLSNILSTIFCTASIDTCRKQIVIRWNKYSNNPLRVIDYRIMVSKNGAPLTATYTADSTANNFIITDFEANANYNYAVMAELEGGNNSSSRKSDTLNTKMQRPPQWINADYATVNDDKNIDLHFTYDPLSEISSFNLEKKTGSSGVYQIITHFTSSSGSLNYEDGNPDIHSVNFYRVSAINNCGLPAIYSNTASNMVLSAEPINDIIKLKWNKYRQWNGYINEYRLLVNTGNGMTERLTLSPADTVLDINYSDYMYEVTGNEICFKIEAIEASNPYGVNGWSFSSSACESAIENISVPNTLIPNPVNPVNATFRPIMSFTPTDYRLIITDLRRKILFETTDYLKVWDGTVNGKVLPEGVYIWFLRVSTPSGRTISKTGTINIIFKR